MAIINYYYKFQKYIYKHNNPIIKLEGVTFGRVR